MTNIQKKLKEGRIDFTQNSPNRDSIKKFYIEPDSKTRLFDNKPFVEFISEVANSSSSESLNMIKMSKVTVNKEIVVDDSFKLQSGDVVRVGVLGHFLQGPNNIAIVK